MPQHFTSVPPALDDGWLGPLDLPGYRAGKVVARLADLPQVYPDHLYFHLLLLDAAGELQDDHSGPCYALARQLPRAERSRFVRVVAELVRHAPSEDRGLSALAQALGVICRLGVHAEHLLLAAQLLDDVSSDEAVALSLTDLLVLSLGADEAQRVMHDVVAGLAHRGALRVPAARGAHPEHQGPSSVADDVDRINAGGLADQVAYVVRSVGKTHARRYLREVIHFALVPMPDMLGV